QFVPPNGMSARLSALYPVDMQRGRVPIDLLPPQVDHLGRPQPMPVGYQEHRLVSMAVSVALRGLDQLFDLSWCEGLAAAKFTVWPSHQRNCSFFADWRDQFQVCFGHSFPPPAYIYCSYNECFTSSTQAMYIARAFPQERRGEKFYGPKSLA